MHSMTGFGQAAAEGDRYRMAVTLRGVNHRYLDLSLRLRDELRSTEPALRELLSSRLRRGRVELTVELTPLAVQPFAVQADERLVASLRGLHDRLVDDGVISAGFELRDLLRLPEAVRVEARPLEWTTEDQDELLAVTGRALEQMVAARQLEGGKLLAVLETRIQQLEELAKRMRRRFEGTTEDAAAALHKRVAELLDGGEKIDDDRLAQEVAYLVDRSDVSEELDRLVSHLEHFRQLMGRDASLGKRLDFLAQEIFRELNTVASKCRDSEMTRLMIDAKVLCEQLREQLQNVE